MEGHTVTTRRPRSSLRSRVPTKDTKSSCLWYVISGGLRAKGSAAHTRQGTYTTFWSLLKQISIMLNYSGGFQSGRQLRELISICANKTQIQSSGMERTDSGGPGGLRCEATANVEFGQQHGDSAHPHPRIRGQHHPLRRPRSHQLLPGRSGFFSCSQKRKKAVGGGRGRAREKSMAVLPWR